MARFIKVQNIYSKKEYYLNLDMILMIFPDPQEVDDYNLETKKKKKIKNVYRLSSVQMECFVKFDYDDPKYTAFHTEIYVNETDYHRILKELCLE